MSAGDLDLSTAFLIRNEWTDASLDVRMKFRQDQTGYYERELAADRPFVHENFLWQIEGEGTLRLKFAHARLWSEVDAATGEGVPTDDGRFGRWLLTLARDPYAWTLEERITGALVLRSDRGAPLP